MRRTSTLWVCGAGLLALAAPCGRDPARVTTAGLALRLELQDTAGRSARRFDAGKPVGLVLEARNAGQAPLRLEFPTARTHDFRIVDAGGKELWRWSHGRLFAQMLTQIELAPGELRRFAAAWDQRDASGSLAAPGRYHVLATLACSPSPPPAGPLELEIE